MYANEEIGLTHFVLNRYMEIPQNFERTLFDVAAPAVKYFPHFPEFILCLNPGGCYIKVTNEGAMTVTPNVLFKSYVQASGMWRHRG